MLAFALLYQALALPATECPVGCTEGEQCDYTCSCAEGIESSCVATTYGQGTCQACPRSPTPTPANTICPSDCSTSATTCDWTCACGGGVTHQCVSPVYGQEGTCEPCNKKTPAPTLAPTNHPTKPGATPSPTPRLKPGQTFAPTTAPHNTTHSDDTHSDAGKIAGVVVALLLVGFVGLLLLL